MIIRRMPEHLLALAVIPFVLFGCGSGEDATSSPPAAQAAELPAGWYGSVEGLARDVLQHLRQKDTEALWSLPVSEQLYKEELCPAFLASKPRHTVPVDFHWQLLRINSLRGLNEILGEYGGRPLELIDVEKPEKIEEYGTFKLWRRVRLTVRCKGEVRSIRILGAIVERDGRFRLLAYPS